MMSCATVTKPTRMVRLAWRPSSAQRKDAEALAALVREVRE
jgi:hypothetical protein